jgi:hypothetical protein
MPAGGGGSGSGGQAGILQQRERKKSISEQCIAITRKERMKKELA